MQKILTLLIAAILVAVPLVSSSHTTLSFELPKVALFLIGNMLLWIIVFTNYLKQPTAYVIPTKTAIWLLIPLTFFTLATLFSPDQTIAFFGSYFRQHGLLTIGALLSWTLALTLLLRRYAEMPRAFVTTTLIAGGSVAVIGLLGSVFPRLLMDWNTSAFFSRAFFPLGQPNFLAQFLILSLPLSAGCLWHEYRQRYFGWQTLSLSLFQWVYRACCYSSLPHEQLSSAYG